MTGESTYEHELQHFYAAQEKGTTEGYIEYQVVCEFDVNEITTIGLKVSYTDAAMIGKTYTPWENIGIALAPKYPSNNSDNRHAKDAAQKHALSFLINPIVALTIWAGDTLRERMQDAIFPEWHAHIKKQIKIKKQELNKF